ncbi:hypothetical protein HB911_08085 [Listeria booriae]|nr:hypothetical protein [Listeria booriae]MBC1558655.1 hypothetical protein [Listeria booriae]
MCTKCIESYGDFSVELQECIVTDEVVYWIQIDRAEIETQLKQNKA